MKRRLINIARALNPSYMRLPDGRYIDKRLINNIDDNRYYKPDEASDILGCHPNLIYKLCPNGQTSEIDARHISWIETDRKYTYRTLATTLSCSESLIRHLSRVGELERLPAGTTYRIPGWSVVQYVQHNAFTPDLSPNLDHIRVSTLVRVPGWSIKDYIISDCSFN